METLRLTTAHHPMFAAAMELYQDSFPLHELRLPEKQQEIMAHPAYHFDLLYDGAAFVGLLLYWETETFYYIEHFCVLPTLRGKNYGQTALALLKSKGKTIVLEIDPPQDDISCRRQQFYLRNGYCVNPYPHVHPPYRAEFSGHALVVLSTPLELKPDAYQAFSLFLRNVVMNG